MDIEDRQVEEEEVEAQRAKVNKTGIVKERWLPSQEEMEEHMLTHSPFRS